SMSKANGERPFGGVITSAGLDKIPYGSIGEATSGSCAPAHPRGAEDATCFSFSCKPGGVVGYAHETPERFYRVAMQYSWTPIDSWTILGSNSKVRECECRIEFPRKCL